ncbi:hypothetical protein A9Q99_05230 [Gammaproteobacteria bacterium 45_16_T64]|nr:hypothetical protein A9Q99_05230 [Gammaproteobacteria bacterium 45_16_T64]
MFSRFRSQPQFVAVLFLLLVATLPAIVRLPMSVSLVCLLPMILHLVPPGKLRKLGLVPLLCLLSFVIYQSFDSWFGGDAIMAFICGLLWLKSSEVSGKRDLWLIMLAVCIVVALNALFGISLWQMSHLFVVMWLLLFNVMALQSSSFHSAWRSIALRCTSYLCISLPFAAVLFFMLPRIPGPLWDLGIAMGVPVKMIQQEQRPSPITGTLKSGQANQNKGKDVAVLIAEFESMIPDNNTLYWRGAVFSHFDGSVWRLPDGWDSRRNVMNNRIRNKADLDKRVTDGSDIIRYQVRVAPHGSYWLYGLDMPFRSAPELVLSKEYQLMGIRPIEREFTYEMQSYLHYTIDATLGDEQRMRALQFPIDTNPKVMGLGRLWAGENKNDADTVAKAKKWFVDAKLTLRKGPSENVVDQSLDDFLFETHKGSAEQLAGSFAMLMRAAGIPSRIVTGYRGGKNIALTNIIVVKQEHAHIWLEVWLQGKGWQRIEPVDLLSGMGLNVPVVKIKTKEKATEIQDQNDRSKAKKQASTLACNKGGDCSWWESEIIARLSAWMQGVELWVVHFDAEKQMDVMEEVGFERGTVGKLLFFSGLSIVVLMLSYMLIPLLIASCLGHKDREKASMLYYRRFTKEMARRGCEPQEGECPSEYEQRLLAAFPEHDESLSSIMSLFIMIRYGGEDEDAALLTEVKQFLATT